MYISARAKIAFIGTKHYNLNRVHITQMAKDISKLSATFKCQWIFLGGVIKTYGGNTILKTPQEVLWFKASNFENLRVKI